MEFKVLFISEKEKLATKKLPGPSMDTDIKDYDFVNLVHCFKILNNHSISEKGIEKYNKELINSSDFLENNEAKRLVSLGFVFINTLNGTLYHHNCNNRKIEALLEKYFLIKRLDTPIDPSKLSKITKIELQLTNDPQMNLFNDNNPIEGSKLMRELELQDQDIRKFTVRYEFKNAFFAKKNLKSILGKYEHLYIEGIDENENIIKIKEAVQLIIELDLDINSFTELNSTCFSTFVKELEKKEKRALSGY